MKRALIIVGIFVLLIGAGIWVDSLRTITPFAARTSQQFASVTIDGFTVSAEDIQTSEKAGLVQDEKAGLVQGTKDDGTPTLAPPKISALKAMKVCFKSLWTKPIPQLSPGMNNWADGAFPSVDDRPATTPDNYCLHGIQVVLQDPSPPVVNGYSTTTDLLALSRKDCAALPGPDNYGLEIFCYAADHATIDANFRIVTSDLNMFKDRPQVFTIATVIVGNVPTSISTIPEGSPACTKFRERFGSGDCHGPFATNDHTVQISLDPSSLTFRLDQCIFWHDADGNCLGGTNSMSTDNAGVTGDVADAIRDKMANLSPAPNF